MWTKLHADLLQRRLLKSLPSVCWPKRPLAASTRQQTVGRTSVPVASSSACLASVAAVAAARPELARCHLEVGCLHHGCDKRPLADQAATRKGDRSVSAVCDGCTEGWRIC